MGGHIKKSTLSIVVERKYCGGVYTGAFIRSLYFFHRYDILNIGKANLID